MIATNNRRDELRKTLESCRRQTHPDKEVHVVDDASTDGTSEMVRADFPEVILSRNEQPLGSVGSRNVMFRRAQGDLLIGFDDDSRLVDSGATARVVERFAREADLGLVSFQDIGPEMPQRIDPNSAGRLTGEWHASSFSCCGYALRRTVLDQTGLFPEFFFHAYEEPDLSLRIWDAGYRCLRWNDVIVWHEFSGLNRNMQSTHYFHARNALLSHLMRMPWQYVLPYVGWTMYAQFVYSLPRGWWLADLRAWRDALRMAGRAWRERRPVAASVVRRCLLLNRRCIVDPQEAWALGK